MPQLTLQQALDLAVQHHQSGRLPQAEQLYRQILAQQPRHAESLHLLGVIAQQVGRLDVAVDLIQQALALNPRWPEAYCNLGATLIDQGRHVEAVAACRRALALKPSYAEAHYNLANALQGTGQIKEAIAAYRQAIVLKPNYSDAYNNLGAALLRTRQLDEAVSSCRQAIALNPHNPQAHINLANTLMGQGQNAEAFAAFRQAIAVRPNLPDAHSNLIFALHCDPGYDSPALLREHLLWNRQHAAPLKHLVQPHDNDPSPARRLRIGYVSPDFRAHPVGCFILPLLAAHDRQQFGIFAYAQVPTPDDLTHKLRAHTDYWRSLVGLSDDQAAQLIRDDRIDVLVDLTMHTAHNRLLVFARKPAPVQVTYLAYCSTTGLDTIDYRLSDPYMDPPGSDDSYYSEQTVRLPQTYWCYQPLCPCPIGSLPTVATGRITFGCLNNFCKITAPTLATWARLLQAVPESQLLLHAAEGSHRARCADQLQRLGIDPQRLRFAASLPPSEYLQLYQQIDIALDPFPYGGGITTCDALWMGVPVISLIGVTAVGRGGRSILSNLGLPELVASTPDQYVQIAAELAGDLPRLTDLRVTLRQRMEQSPLMDAPRFARNIESAYRRIWHKWCANSATPSTPHRV